MMIPVETVTRRAGGRVPVVAGNWKMNTALDEALELIEELIEPLDQLDGVECLICPPFVWLPLLYESVEGTSVKLGAQNLHWAEKGAYTGEISPTMLIEFCDAAIVGHSERRHYFAETDEIVNRKVKAALGHSLRPLICVGENLEQRDAGVALSHVAAQVRAALADVTNEQMADVLLAYEPIWAIGTGRAATPEDANTVIGAIRATVADLFGPVVAASQPILYGGSVTAKNIAALMAMPEPDGALVGGASLQADDFILIAQAVARARAG